MHRTRTTHAWRSCWLVVGLLIAIPSVAPAAKKKKDKDEEKTTLDWKHPWASDRYFDYTDERWEKHDPRKEFDLFYDEVHTTWELQADGRHRYTWDVVMKVNEPESLPDVLSLGYLDASRNTEVVEFEASFTSAGRTRQLGEDRLIEVSDEPFGLYITGGREVGLVLPRDEPGLLKVRYVGVQDPMGGAEDYFGGAVRVLPGAACALRTITIKAPEGTDMQFHRRYFWLKPTEAVEDGVSSWTYTFEKLNFLRYDPAMPHRLDAFPALFFSNMASWEELGAIKSASWEEQLVSTEEIDAWAASLVEGVEGTLPRARAIHDAVADGWDYLGFYPGESGWVPHPAPEVHEARLGDCKDQSGLMVTAMRSVGLDANPAVIWSGRRFRTPKVPAIVSNHVIVYVADAEHADGGFFLDSTDTGMGDYPLPQRMSRRDALVLDPDGAFLASIAMADREHRLHDTEILVGFEDDGGARLTIEERWYGERANSRLGQRRRTDPHTWKRGLRERLTRAVPGGRVEQIEEGPDPEDADVWLQTAVVTSDELVVRNGEHAVINLPWLDSWGTRIHVEKRRLHPRELRGAWDRSRIRIQLPDGAELVHHPGQGGEERDSFSNSITSEVVDRELQVELEVEFQPGRMTRKHEEVRRNFHIGLAKLQRRPVVLLMSEVQP